MRETGIDRPGFIGATRPINGHVSAPESLPLPSTFFQKKTKNTRTKETLKKNSPLRNHRALPRGIHYDIRDSRNKNNYNVPERYGGKKNEQKTSQNKRDDNS